MIAGIDHVVPLLLLVEHTQRGAIFAIRLGVLFLGASGREDKDILYARSLQDIAEDPLAFHMTLLVVWTVVIVAVPVADQRREPVIILGNLVGLSA